MTGKTCKSTLLINKPLRTLFLSCLPRVRLLPGPQQSGEQWKGAAHSVRVESLKKSLVFGECGLSILWLIQQPQQLSLESLPVWDRNSFVRGQSMGWLVGSKLLIPEQWVIASKLQLVLRRDLRESSGFKPLFLGLRAKLLTKLKDW